MSDRDYPRRAVIDKKLAYMEDAGRVIRGMKPLNDAEKQAMRFLIRDLAGLIDSEVAFDEKVAP